MVSVLLVAIVRLELSENSNVPVPDHVVTTMTVVVFVNVHLVAGRGTGARLGEHARFRKFRDFAKTPPRPHQKVSADGPSPVRCRC